MNLEFSKSGYKYSAEAQLEKGGVFNVHVEADAPTDVLIQFKTSGNKYGGDIKDRTNEYGVYDRNFSNNDMPGMVKISLQTESKPTGSITEKNDE